MGLGFRKFISEVFVNGKFPKFLPSEIFLLYGRYVLNNILNCRQCRASVCMLPWRQLDQVSVGC